MLKNKGGSDGGAPTQVNVIARALDILELFEQSPGPMSMMEVARRTGLHKATAFRLLSSLVHDQILQQAQTGEYDIGSFATRRAKVIGQADSLWRNARPIMETLSAELNESVVFTRRYGDDCVDLDLVSASTPVMKTPAIGRRVPLHANLGGCAILSAEPISAREDYIRRVAGVGADKAAILAAIKAGETCVAAVVRRPDSSASAVIWLTIAPGRAVNAVEFGTILRGACKALCDEGQ